MALLDDSLEKPMGLMRCDACQKELDEELTIIGSGFTRDGMNVEIAFFHRCPLCGHEWV